MRIPSLMITAAAAIATVGCTTMDTAATNTVAETVVMSPNHETLESLVMTANLGETLGGTGPFTVFAPTDAAFSRVPQSQRTALTQPANREMLRGVLTYHVVAGDYSADDIIGLINSNGGTATLTTVQGTPLRASLEGSFVKLTDATGGTAYVETADIDGTNGVVHSINGVLMPRN